MTDETDPPLPPVPQAVQRGRKRWPAALLWLIPVVALLFAAWLGVQALRERGATITISFKSAEGIEPRKTKIKYKNVDVGEVRNVVLSEDRTRVDVTAQFSRQALDLLVEDTRFWVVRPRVSGGAVTGLSTLLVGSHIGMDPGTSPNSVRAFVGLEQPATVTSDLPGRQFILRGEDVGSLDVGSPLYFRHIQVGQVVSYELNQDGNGVTLKIFVNAPYDRYVNVNSRFWHADGVDLTLDANGLKINTQSIISILLGGLAFETLPGAATGPPASTDATFNIYADRERAMKPYDAGLETYMMVFKESVRGLTVGAPVDFRGVVIGEVVAIDIGFDRTRREITVPVTVRLSPDRLRARRGNAVAGESTQQGSSHDFLGRLIERGFRAQLRTANLLTNQLYIAADFFPSAPKVKVDWSMDPPELPTVPGSLQELQVTLAAIAKKIEALPLDAIGNDLRKAMQDTSKLMAQLDRDTAPALRATMQTANRLLEQLDRDAAPELRSTLADARRTLAGLERMVGADAPLQQDAREALREVGKAARAFRILSDYLERHPESLLRGKPEDPK
ncbi:MAG: MlaD family protein [Betaproteobacteria bacterium]